MNKIKKRLSALVGFLILVLCFSPRNVLACGDSYDWAYEETMKNILALPYADFYREVERLRSRYCLTHVCLEKQKDKKVQYWDIAEQDKKKTVEKDLDDLRQALKEHHKSEAVIQQTLETYTQARDQLTHFLEKRNNSIGWGEGGDFRHFLRFAEVKAHVPYSLWLPEAALNRSLEKLLPREFLLYWQGAVAFHQTEFAQAWKAWKDLLTLPAGQRRYRSTWAAFMLAKTYFLLRRYPEAYPYFLEVRQLVKQGFHDSIDLATESWGWQARAEWEQGNQGLALRHYLVQDDVHSLHQVTGDLLSAPEEKLKTYLGQPLLRSLLLAWLLSQRSPSPKAVSRLLQVLRTLDLPRPVSYADRLAWIAYSAGQFDEAQAWLRIAFPSSFITRFVQAKLALREGQIDRAVALLHVLLPSFRLANNTSLQNNIPVGKHKGDVWGNAAGDLGVLLVSRHDYVLALEAFLQAQAYTDAAYVAENILTLPELKNYVDVRREDARDFPKNSLSDTAREPLTWISHLLARRLARNKQWNQACPYYPDDMRPIFDRFRYSMETAENIALSAGVRARAYLIAAEILRDQGGSLMGKYEEPDWDYGPDEEGRGWEYPTFLRTSRRLEKSTPLSTSRTVPNEKNAGLNRVLYQASPEEIQRVHQTEQTPKWTPGLWVSPPTPFHSRYAALALMKKAADLLPDNDNTACYALYQAGSDLRLRNPAYAEDFYQTIVQRCRRHSLGQIAERARWLPDPSSPAGVDLSAYRPAFLNNTANPPASLLKSGTDTNLPPPRDKKPLKPLAKTPFLRKTTQWILHPPYVSTDALLVREESMDEHGVHRIQMYIFQHGVKSPPYDEISHPLFSLGGKHFMYRTRKGSRETVVFDGVEQPFYQAIKDLRFSAGGHHWLYAAAQRDKDKTVKWFMVYDGRPQTPYDFVSYPMFNSTGTQWGYTARKGKKEFIILNGWEQKAYALAGHLYFSADGRHWAYRVLSGNGWSLVFDNKEILIGGNRAFVGFLGDPVMNSNGQVWGCRAAEWWRGSKFIIHQGKIQPDYKQVGVPVISPDGKHWAYWAVKSVSGGNQDERDVFTMVYDGREEALEWIPMGNPVFAPNRRHWAYLATQAGKEFVVYDGKKQNPYEEVEQPVFSDRGSHYAYVARKEKSEGMVRDGIEQTFYTHVSTPVFCGDTSIVAYRALDAHHHEWAGIGRQSFGPYDQVGYPSFSRDCHWAEFSYQKQSRQNRQDALHLFRRRIRLYPSSHHP